ncbi:MAG TPA: glycosyltransferase [Baekduia sp.]|nr:glycosyltransferase [Baekduia sp.]
MRVLIVTQMWPGPRDPDLGSFLVPHVAALRDLGHEVEVVAIAHRGGSAPRKYAGLVARAVRAARRWRPDVVLAHVLFPAGFAGLAAARVARVPLVVMAHGTDVENCARPALRRATAPVVRGAAAVIANSRWLADRLAGHFPGLDPVVADLGVDLDDFAPGQVPVPWPGEHPRFLCVGSLIERKNVVRLADAFAALGRGSLAYVGDGPLRGALEGRPGVTVAGRIPHEQVPAWIAACDVLCQPSVREPFGLAALEGMAQERTVVATTDGGPPEFVTPEAGVLVDPADTAALTAAMERAAAMPTPNPAARAAAQEHSVQRMAARMSEVLAAAVAADAAS